MLDTSGDLMRMDSAERAVSTALHLPMKSERLFPADLHRTGCGEPEFNFRFHSHHHRQPAHLLPCNGLSTESTAAQNAVSVALQTALQTVNTTAVPRTMVTQSTLLPSHILIHSSPIGIRSSTNSTESSHTMIVSGSVHNPIQNSFQTSSPCTIPASMALCTNPATASSQSKDHSSGLIPKPDESDVMNILPSPEGEHLNETDPAVPTGASPSLKTFGIAGFPTSNGSEVAWSPYFDRLNSQNSDPIPTTTSSACFDALSVQTDSIGHHRCQRTVIELEPTGAADLLSNYVSPATTHRSDVCDRLSQTPTSISDDELRSQLLLLRHGQTVQSHLSGRFERYRPTNESNSGPSNGLEDAASLEVSSETQRAMESSDSSPPSSGPGLPNSTEKVNPLDDLVRDLTFHGQRNSTDWSTPQRQTTDTPEPETPVSKRPNGPDVCAKRSMKSPDLDAVVQQSPIALVQSHSISMICDEAPSSPDDSDEGMSMARFEHMTNSIQPDRTGVFFCHLCEFTGGSRQEFQDHLRSHYDYKCLKCDYTSRTEGRLKRHMKDFHSEVPPDNFSGKALRPMRPKLQRCKQCDFMTETKDEFWRHLRIHIKEDKRLECNLCCFVTEYKHHLEYHMRNHMGSKPYKCPKCNYECVNKSMLNSHMKSHSNVYPYRCANCHYATKYCHSLKLHLTKHDHKPAVVLNADGSLPSYDNTAELMSLRRGSGIRQGSGGRIQSFALKVADSMNSAHQSEPMQQSNQQQPKESQSLQLLTPQSCQQQPQQSPFFNSMSTLMPFGGQTPLVRPFMPGPLNGLSSVPGFEHLLIPNTQTIPFPMNTAPLPPFSGFIFANPTLFDSSNLFPGLFNQSGKPMPLTTAATDADALTTTAPPGTIACSSSLPSSSIDFPDVSRTNLPNSADLPLPSPNPSVMAAFLNAVQQSSNFYPTNLLQPASTPTVPVLGSMVDAASSLGSSSKISTAQEDDCSIAENLQAMQQKYQVVGPELMDNTHPPSNELNHTVSKQHMSDNEQSCDRTSASAANLDQNMDTDGNGALDLSSKMSHSENQRPADDSTVVHAIRAELVDGTVKSEGEPSRTGCSRMLDEPMHTHTAPEDTICSFDYECRFCEILFRQRALYDIHMGFHSHSDPYLCNRCGHQSRNPVDFFIHLGQMAHHA